MYQIIYLSQIANVASLAQSCPLSIIHKNKEFLRAVVQHNHNEEENRVAAQILKLNRCLDGEMNCDLDAAQIKDR